MEGFCRALFRLAGLLARWPDHVLPDPTRLTVQGDRVALGARARPTFALYGTERQFHRWHQAIRSWVLATAFDYRDGVCGRRQEPGLAHLLQTFFRNTSDQPALLWTSPVWVRAVNWAGDRGLDREDETLATPPYGRGTAGASAVPVRFASGDEFEVPVRGASALHFRYRDAGSERASQFLGSWRRRTLLDADRIPQDTALEEAIILADPDEPSLLRAGLYSGNFPYHLERQGVRFLNLHTLTLARLAPRRRAGWEDPRDSVLTGRITPGSRGRVSCPPSIVRAAVRGARRSPRTRGSGSSA